VIPVADQHGPHAQRDPYNPNEPADFVDRRHERVYRSVMRSRQSRIPTWVYAVTLAALVAAWVVWIALG
jgi:hypothetical protein